MKKSIAISVLLLCFTALAPLSHAVTTGSALPARTLPETTTVIERGGTVNAVDPEKGTITVDDVAYRMNPRTLPIHPSPRSGASKFSVMPIGSKIQFRTSRPAFSGQESVTEVWVVK